MNKKNKSNTKHRSPITDNRSLITKKYSYGKQTINATDIRSVVKILRSDWLTQGPTISKFENALNKKFGGKYASAVSSGTAGLHLIALGLGWKKDDVIITSPITFLASANCAVYVGATPDFADINESTYTIDPNKLEDKLKFYLSQNKKVKAVIAVDYAGNPCDWSSLKTLKDKYEFQLIDDYCHALGAEYERDIKYPAKYTDAVNLSFHPVKHITTGEGGAVLTNDERLNNRIKTFRTHGITKDESVLEKNDGSWYYEMHEPGFNYRITDFQCALGLNQLKKLTGFLKKRRAIAKYYDKVFGRDERFIIPHVAQEARHAYHLYPLQIKFDELKISKKTYFEKLKQKGIGCQVHYVPVHLQPFYRKNYRFKPNDFPVAEKFYERELSIPMYPSLTEKDLAYISKTIIETLNKAK